MYNVQHRRILLGGLLGFQIPVQTQLIQGKTTVLCQMQVNKCNVSRPRRTTLAVLKLPSGDNSTTAQLAETAAGCSPRQLLNILKLGVRRALQDGNNFEPFEVARAVECDALEAVWSRLDRIKGARIRLLDGTVHFYDVPLQPHELICGVFNMGFVGYNLQCSEDRSDPMHSMGASRISAGHDTLLEPDCSFFNRRVQGGGQQDPVTKSFRPSIVVEVGLCESFVSLVHTAEAYLRRCPTVRVVISVKLWRASNAPGLKVSELVCMVHYRADVVEGVSPTPPRHLISFGERLHPSRRQSVLACSGAPLANCSGVGFGGPPCTQTGIPQYQFRVDGAELWHDVPPNQQPATGTTDFTLDLFASVIETLRMCQCIT